MQSTIFGTEEVPEKTINVTQAINSILCEGNVSTREEVRKEFIKKYFPEFKNIPFSNITMVVTADRIIRDLV